MAPSSTIRQSKLFRQRIRLQDSIATEDKHGDPTDTINVTINGRVEGKHVKGAPTINIVAIPSGEYIVPIEGLFGINHYEQQRRQNPPRSQPTAPDTPVSIVTETPPIDPDPEPLDPANASKIRVLQAEIHELMQGEETPSVPKLIKLLRDEIAELRLRPPGLQILRHRGGPVIRGRGLWHG